MGVGRQMEILHYFGFVYWQQVSPSGSFLGTKGKSYSVPCMICQAHLHDAQGQTNVSAPWLSTISVQIGTAVQLTC